MMVHKNNKQLIKVVTKLIKLVLIIANIGLVKAQYTAIPDSCFEQHLIDLNIDSEGSLDGQVLTADIINVTSLTMRGNDNGVPYSCYIDNLQGIDSFTSLETLDVNLNGIQYLDLSNLPNLKNLYCDDNFMQTLALPPSIEVVYARFNLFSQNIDFSQTINIVKIHLNSHEYDVSHITEINVNNCPNLVELRADFNNLESINTSNNPLLEVLKIINYDALPLTTFTHNNPNLKELILVGNLTSLNINEMVNLEYLQVLNNSIPSINLTHNINLQQFRYDDNATTEIDIRNGNNTNLTIFSIGNVPTLSCIYVDDASYSQTNWTNVDSDVNFVETEAECEALSINSSVLENNLVVYPNPVKNSLYIKNITNLKEVLVYNTLGQLIITTESEVIDFSNLKEGIYFIKVKTIDGNILSKKIIKS
jgi:hypothetical protein